MNGGQISGHPRAVAAHDRQMGIMPSSVQSRLDSDELWVAFRRHVGIAWTGRRLDDFIAGWDAQRRTAR